MTVTNHTAIYKFTFPKNGKAPYANEDQTTPLSPLILLDLTDLPDTRQNATVNVHPDTGRITATGTFRPSFGIGTYVLHACADFQGAEIRDTGVFVLNRAGSFPKNVTMHADGINDPPLPAGAWTQFHAPNTSDNSILARVGVSFISEAQACQNAETELPNFEFEEARESATEVWREKLNVISVDSTGVSDSIKTIFWSGVYRAMISPQDYTGENPLWDSDEPCKFDMLS